MARQNKSSPHLRTLSVALGQHFVAGVQAVRLLVANVADWNAFAIVAAELSFGALHPVVGVDVVDVVVDAVVSELVDFRCSAAAGG